MLQWTGGGTTSTFNNNSTLSKNAGSGVAIIETHFHNSNAVTVSMGELHLGHSASTATSTGSFQVDAGTILGVAGNNTMTAASSFTGDGGFLFINGGTTVIQGSYGLTGTLEVKKGTLSFEVPVSIEDHVSISGGTLGYTMAPSAINADVLMTTGTLMTAVDLPISGMLEQSSGTMTGSGKVTVAGMFNWAKGTQSGDGETVANGGMVMSGTVGRALNTRTLTLNGTSSWTGGTVQLWNNAIINNNALFEIQTDNGMLQWTGGGTTSTFNNNSTLSKNAGSGVAIIGAFIINPGSITVTSGTLNFGKTFEQTAIGTLTVEIASNMVFDSYAITQSATLDGTLTIDLLGGFEPVVGTTFVIMTFPSLSGTFATINGIDIGNGTHFEITYGATDISLTVVLDP
jgi:hypothetical protein